MKTYTPTTETIYYRLCDLETGKLVLTFGVNFERKAGNHQEVINRIVELGYNPLLYTFVKTPYRIIEAEFNATH